MDKDYRELADEFGGWWGKHPNHPPSDWSAEVSENETRLGYWEWVSVKLEDADSDL
jgi:hypothetical protein